MSRLLFAKEGNAVWISHLDLMRVFQRSFRRAGLMLKHTQGYSPRAIVSIALPLSVGVESRCELLDYDLEGEAVPAREVQHRLNLALPAGIRVLRVYENGRKIRELSHLRVQVDLEYDGGVPEGAAAAIGALFAGERLPVMKHSKKGDSEVDILPMIRSMRVKRADENTLQLDCVICAQNPSLNPSLLARAVESQLPQWKPSFTKSRRIEILDAQGAVFR